MAMTKINRKSEFFKSRSVFAGRVFDGHTKSIKEESVHHITQLVKPYNLRTIRGFLGLADHSRAFINDSATKTRCLTAITKKEVYATGVRNV